MTIEIINGDHSGTANALQCAIGVLKVSMVAGMASAWIQFARCKASAHSNKAPGQLRGMSPGTFPGCSQIMKILSVPSSGSYENLTHSRNRFGQYVRSRSTPVNPSSTFQANVRARLATNAQNYRDLTAVQREGWQSLGDQIQRTDSLGQTYTLTGFQAYCLVNNNKMAAGDATVADAIAYLPPDPVLTITPTATAATLSVAYTATPLGTGVRAFVSASPQRSAGRTYEGDMRLISVTAAAAASPANIFSAYQARMGTPVVGNRIFVAVQTYLAGLVSVPIISSVIVA